MLVYNAPQSRRFLVRVVDIKEEETLKQDSRDLKKASDNSNTAGIKLDEYVHRLTKVYRYCF